MADKQRPSRLKQPEQTKSLPLVFDPHLDALLFKYPLEWHRKSLGLSQGEMAQYLGMARMTYAQHEKNPNTMKLGDYRKVVLWLCNLERVNDLELKDD